MEKTGNFLRVFYVSIFFFAFFFLFSGVVSAADRYWVGGTGNWSDDDNHWASSSGGAPADGNIPTAGDNCIFDTESNAGNVAYIMTLDTSATCLDFTMDGPGGGNNVTWAGGSDLAISGSMNLIGGSADITRTYNGVITFNSTIAGQTITTNGRGLGRNINFDGVGGSWQLLGALNISSSGYIVLINGSFDTNDQTLTAAGISSTDSGVRTLDLGSSTINLSGFYPVQMADIDNFTFIAGTSNININSNATTSSFLGGGLTYNNVTITFSVFGTANIAGSNTFNNLTINGPANKFSGVTFSADQTINGTLTISGNSVTNRILVYSDTSGTARALSSAVATLTNVDFQDITGAGVAAPFTGTSLGDALGNTNIIFTTNTRYWVGGTGSWSVVGEWSATSGGAGGASVPLPQDAVIFDANSFSAGGQIVTTDMPRLGADIDFTNVTNNPTINFTPDVSLPENGIFGSLSLSADMTFSGSEKIIFFSRSVENLTTNGVTFTGDIYMKSAGGEIVLQDDVNSNESLIILQGTFQTNDFNVNIKGFVAHGTLIKVLEMGSGTWVIDDYFSGQIGNTFYGVTTWYVGDGASLDLNYDTSTIQFEDSSDTGIYFTGGGETYHNVLFSGSTGGGQYSISGNNTFNQLADDNILDHTIVFESGTTQTIANWDISGNPSELITINSTDDSTVHNLVFSGVGDVSADYLNIQHSVATPADTWYAGANSVDNQAVADAGSGWIFTVPPTPSEEGGGGSSGSNPTRNNPPTPEVEDPIIPVTEDPEISFPYPPFIPPPLTISTPPTTSDPISPPTNTDEPTSEVLPPTSSGEPSTFIPEVIREVIDNIPTNPSQIVEEGRSALKIPEINLATKLIGLIGLLAGLLGSLSLSVSDIGLSALQLWSFFLYGMGFKRRNRPWGVVYDAITKQPLDPAYVVLSNLAGEEIATSITDLDGRYGFLIEPGIYKLSANKTNYTFPSKKLIGKTSDELYSDLYFGDTIEMKTSGEVITKNIPLDPIKFDWNEFAKRDQSRMKFYHNRDRFVGKLTDVLFFFGFLVSTAVLFLVAVPYNIIIFCLYLALFGLRRTKLAKNRRGSVVDKTGNPISYGILRVYSASTGQEMSHRVLDRTGGYYCLIPNGIYIVSVEKKNADSSYSRIFTSGKIEVKHGILKKRFKV